MIKYQYLKDLASEKISKYKDTDRVQKAGPVTHFYYLGHVICRVNHYTVEFMLLGKADVQYSKDALVRLDAYNDYFRSKGYRKVKYFSDILD